MEGQRKGFLRNSIFGAEDSLVSTVGLLSGVSFAGLSSREIVVSGVILIVVEALSMGAGTYIADDSTNQLETVKSERENQLYNAVVMFISYVLVGLIPLSPYLLGGDTRIAFYYSLGATLFALFCLGIFRGFYVGRSIWKSAVKIALIGSVTAGVGIAVGLLLR
ncbi:MAG: VIT1/CCC1 transporter family protein [Patescibacteria group bacterium]